MVQGSNFSFGPSRPTTAKRQSTPMFIADEKQSKTSLVPKKSYDDDIFVKGEQLLSPDSNHLYEDDPELIAIYHQNENFQNKPEFFRGGHRRNRDADFL